MVRLGITTADAFVPRYRGNTTATSWPCATSAFGSASTTSARPPVFENGSPSDATNKILIAYSPPPHGQLRNHFTLPEGCCIVKKPMCLGQSKVGRPSAERDRARHPRFAAFHGAASARRSTLLDRNRLRARRNDCASSLHRLSGLRRRTRLVSH